jgi:hypothetical protein
VIPHDVTERRSCAFLELRELGRLGDARAQPQTETHEHHAHEQRQAPAPHEELILRHQRQRERDGAACDQRADRWAHLRERCIATALPVVAMLHGQQYCAGPLAAERHALREAQRHQQDGREHADLFVGGKQAYQHRRDAHHEQRDDEHEPAAMAIAQMPEHDAAERT